MEDSNHEVEPEYDDDTAIHAADLVAVHLDGETSGVEEDADEGGGVLLPLNPEEEELTDRDADGETDPEYATGRASSESDPTSDSYDSEEEGSETESHEADIDDAEIGDGVVAAEPLAGPSHSPRRKRKTEEIDTSSAEDSVREEVAQERVKRARYAAPSEISVPSLIAGRSFVLSDSE